jgi:mono/diheme cytochrome c family protein
MSRILLGIILGLLLVPVVGLVYFKFGNIPVAVEDPPFPFERQLTHIPLNARIDREMISQPPIQPSGDNFIAGAHIYADKCAFCHGVYGQPSQIGKNMFPDAPPLWQKHHNGAVVGVSDDPPGETYWKVANGIRLTGMPSYKKQLTDTEMWQVTLLLANADKPLPPAALDLLRAPGPSLAPPSAAPAK